MLLELVQIPAAWSLARRLRRGQRQRETLLQHAVDASDTERRRIARDLHDGVVQDLAGVSFALAAAARAPEVPTQTQAVLDDSARAVRDSGAWDVHAAGSGMLRRIHKVSSAGATPMTNNVRHPKAGMIAPASSAARM